MAMPNLRNLSGLLSHGWSTRVAALALVAAMSLGQGAGAQSLAAGPLSATPLGGLPQAALQRFTDPQSVADQLDRHGHVPVIVEFAAPILPAGVQSGSEDEDALVTAAVRETQDRILGRLLPSEAVSGASGPASDESLGISRMQFSPLFALVADSDMLQALAADPEVVRIHINGVRDPMLTQSLPLIGMPAAYSAGGTGNGRVVAVLDTGGRRSHEHLSSRIIAEACYNQVSPNLPSSSLCPGGVAQSTARGSGEDCTNPAWAGCGHGTHVASTAAGFVANPGSGVPPHGVARDARIMSINVFSLFPRSECGPNIPANATHCVRTWDSDQVLAMERVYALRNTHNFSAVNMSLGGGQFSSACGGSNVSHYRPIVQQLTNAGIAVIASAGNNGFDNAIGFPACVPEVIAIGNTDNSDRRNRSSNWGSLVDLAAPGTAINAAYISGSSNNSYARLTGTSMSAPHVAGAFAAIQSVHPNATVAQIRDALAATGTGVTAAGRTIPRINVDRALARLGGGQPGPGPGPTSTTTRLSGPTSSTQGSSVTFTAEVSASSGTPTGSVSFRRNGQQFASVSLNAQGRATASTSNLPVGTSTITAVYAGTSSFSGSTSNTLSHVVSRPSAPPNNLFADRVNIASPGRVTGSNVGATSEPGQPSIAVPGSTNAVWWRFTPSSNGTLTIDTFGSDFDTTLAVFTGSRVDALTLVQANDDASGGTLQSQVEFTAQAGTQYQIAVAGYNNRTGNITLNLGFQVATTTTLEAPTNAVQGLPAIFNVQVRPSSGSGTPRGTVSLRRGTTEIGRETLDSNGNANFQITDLPLGTSSIRAHYLGGSGFAASTSPIARVTVRADPRGFFGGGTVFSPSPECGNNFGSAHPVTMRYSPSEFDGPPSGVSIVWPEGSEHLALWGPMETSSNFFGGAGRSSWTRFVFYPTRPLIRVASRRVTQPAGASIDRATELVLRLRVQNFAAMPGCVVTVVGTMRRG